MKHQSSLPADTVGIDTVAVSFPVTNYWAPAFSLPGHGRLIIRHYWAFVEASLPRRQFGHNVTALPVGQLHEAVKQLVEEACTYTEPIGEAAEPHKLHIRRIDCVRDFDDVGQPPLLLRDLAAIPQRGNLDVSLHKRRGVNQTVTVAAPSAWSASFYDKHAESPHHAPAGRMRFEVRSRPDRLLSVWATKHAGKVRVLADAHPDKLLSLTKATFDDLGYDTDFASADEVARHVSANTNLTPQERRRLLQYLQDQAHGCAVEMSDGTRRKYERLARALGLRISADVTAGTSRLDWSTGRYLSL